MIRLPLRLMIAAGLVCVALVQAALVLGHGLPGDVLAYTLQRSYGFGDLYLIDLRTLTEANITRTSHMSEGHPVWSPDSRRVAYYRADTTASSPFICIFDSKTQCYLTNDTFGSALRWSPDGHKVIYIDTSDVFHLLDIDSSVSQKRDLGVRPFYWDWSPDGSRFLLTGENRNLDPSECCAIYLAKGDLSDVHVIYQGNLHITSAPSWSPDGKQIVFSASDGIDPPHLYRLDTESDQLRTLSNFPDENPGWSPDGSQIAFISDRTGSRELYLMTADGTSQRIVSEVGHWRNLQYVWSPDGSRLLFVGDRSGNLGQVFILDLRSKQIEALPSGDGRKDSFTWRP